MAPKKTSTLKAAILATTKYNVGRFEVEVVGNKRNFLAPSCIRINNGIELDFNGEFKVKVVELMNTDQLAQMTSKMRLADDVDSSVDLLNSSIGEPIYHSTKKPIEKETNAATKKSTTKKAPAKKATTKKAMAKVENKTTTKKQDKEMKEGSKKDTAITFCRPRNRAHLLEESSDSSVNSKESGASEAEDRVGMMHDFNPYSSSEESEVDWQLSEQQKIPPGY